MLIGSWLLGRTFNIRATLLSTGSRWLCSEHVFIAVQFLLSTSRLLISATVCVWLAEQEVLFMPKLHPCLPRTRQSSREKVTYAAAAAMPSFLQFNSIQLVTPACGCLPLIAGQYVFAPRVSCRAKTSWWDCFCRRFPRVYKKIVLDNNYVVRSCHLAYRLLFVWRSFSVQEGHEAQQRQKELSRQTHLCREQIQAQLERQREVMLSHH